MENLKQYILNHATRKGACGFGIEEAKKAETVTDFIDLLLTPKGIEHCMQYQFPSIGILKQFIEPLKQRNVYVSGFNQASNVQLLLAFGGEVELFLTGYSVCDVYATNDAKVTIHAADNSICFVEIFHQAKVFVNQSGNAKVKEFKKCLQ